MQQIFEVKITISLYVNLTRMFIFKELISVIPFSKTIMKGRLVFNYLIHCMWPLTSSLFILFSHLIQIVNIEDSVSILFSQELK